MKCGMSEVQITPWLGNCIPGQINLRKSEGVLDELYAKALVIETKEQCAAIIVIDSLDLKRYMVEAIRRRVNEHTDIPESSIMVSATHSHTAGPVRNGFAGKKDEEYIQFLIKKSADSAILAYRKRKEARIGFGGGYESEISFNRRFYMKNGSVRTNAGVGNPDIDRPEGPIDPEVLVVRIDDLEGNPLGIVSNFALHLDTVGGVQYSADYVGEISRQIKKTLGSDCISLFMLGACGNINHVDVSGQLPIKDKHYILIGGILSAEILKVRGKIQTVDHAELKLMKTTFPITLRVPTDEQITWCKSTLESEKASKLERAIAKKQLELLSVKDDDPHRDIELQAFRIGEWSLID